ncbi:MFS transporter [Streptomyces sp. NPDC047002]|uniref:MFS transporter n=1 Tax=Streptomyces sp. NPDC047002 TaxID=3155475 RepID=UPI003456C8DA
MTAVSPPAVEGAKGPAVGRASWLVLAITLVFWVADGYDTFVLIITGKPALLDLLPAGQAAAVPRYMGYLLAITLAGWATGGIVGGIVGDRLGRRRTMVAGVALYSLATVVAATTGTWWLLGVTRFFTGVGIGAEWGVGTSLLQETWPERWRTRGAGLLQAGFSLGGLVVSALWVLVGSTWGLSWRWMYVFGVLPLVVIALVYRRIPESARWASGGGRGERAGLLRGATGRRFLAALGVSVAITVGWWAVSSYQPTFVGGLVADPRRTAFYTGWAGALYNVGEIAGCIAFGFLAEAWGRRATTLVFLAGSCVIVPVVFLGLHEAGPATLAQLAAGLFTGGLYSWYAVHTPELFATRMRATAISAVFSGARYLAMIASVVSGSLASALGGFDRAAVIFTPVYLLGAVAVLCLPETRGKGLPA